MTRLTPNWVQGGDYAADEDRRLVGALWPAAACNGMKVAPGSGMAVSVASGQTAVPVTGKGTILCTSTAAEIVAITPAPVTGQERWDLIILRPRAQEIDGSTGFDDFIFDVVTGTPAVPPAVKPTKPATALTLAEVKVVGGSTSVPANQVFDKRPTQQLAVPPATGDATAWVGTGSGSGMAGGKVRIAHGLGVVPKWAILQPQAPTSVGDIIATGPMTSTYIECLVRRTDGSTWPSGSGVVCYLACGTGSTLNLTIGSGEASVPSPHADTHHQAGSDPVIIEIGQVAGLEDALGQLSTPVTVTQYATALGAGATPSTTATTPGPLVPGNLLMLLERKPGNGWLTDPAAAGWTLARTTVGGSGREARVWWRAIDALTPNTWTSTHDNPSATGPDVTLLEVMGANTVDPILAIDAPPEASGAMSATVSVSGVPTKGLVIGWWTTNQNPTWDAAGPAGWTHLAPVTIRGRHAWVRGAPSVSGTWSWTAANMTSIAFAIALRPLGG